MFLEHMHPDLTHKFKADATRLGRLMLGMTIIVISTIVVTTSLIIIGLSIN